MFRTRIIKLTGYAIPIVFSTYLKSSLAFNQSIEEDEDEYWETKKNECSFCKMFLESPCKEEFKKWSKCVDAAKKEEQDFKEICSFHSKELFTCTSIHHEYFRQLNDAMDDNSEETREEEEDVVSGDDVVVSVSNDNHVVVVDDIAVNDAIGSSKEKEN